MDLKCNNILHFFFLGEYTTMLCSYNYSISEADLEILFKPNVECYTEMILATKEHVGVGITGILKVLITFTLQDLNLIIIPFQLAFSTQ